MKTIEERAKFALAEYTKDDIQWHDEYEDGITIGKKTGFKDGYIQGATEQKKIDEDHLREVKKMVVDKACEWLFKNIPDYEIHDGKIYEKGIVKRFRKAMGE